jgi:hypothetical protein
MPSRQRTQHSKVTRSMDVGPILTVQVKVKSAAGKQHIMRVRVLEIRLWLVQFVIALGQTSLLAHKLKKRQWAIGSKQHGALMQHVSVVWGVVIRQSSGRYFVSIFHNIPHTSTPRHQGNTSFPKQSYSNFHVNSLWNWLGFVWKG